MLHFETSLTRGVLKLKRLFPKVSTFLQGACAFFFSDELFLISLKIPENESSKCKGIKGLILSLEVQVHEG